MLRFAPHLAVLVLSAPILCGLLATLLPAFGYFPVLGGTEFSLDAFRMLLSQPGILRSSLVSLATGLVTTAVSLALVLGFFAAWSDTRFFARIQHLVSPLLSIPHAAAAFGFAFMIMPSGWLMRLVSPGLTGITRPPDVLILNDPFGLAMMAGLIVKEIPFLFLLTLAAMSQVRAVANQRVATALGYGRMAGFLLVLGPPLYRQIRLAVFAVIGYYLIGRKQNVVDFMVATEGEMKKVNWSTRREIVGSTWVVIALTIAIALLCMFCDGFFAFIFQQMGVLETGP